MKRRTSTICAMCIITSCQTTNTSVKTVPVANSEQKDTTAPTSSSDAIGFLAKDEIRKAIVPKKSEITKCLSKTQSCSESKVVTKFEIDEKGVVQNVSVIESNSRNEKFDECIQAKVRTIEFPSGYKKTTVIYPWIFKCANSIPSSGESFGFEGLKMK